MTQKVFYNKLHSKRNYKLHSLRSKAAFHSVRMTQDEAAKDGIKRSPCKSCATIECNLVLEFDHQ